jgi:hypothetical protein
MPEMFVPDVDLLGNHILVPVWADTPDAPEDILPEDVDVERRFVEEHACFERARAARGWSKIAAAHEYMGLLGYRHDRIALLLSLIEFEPAEVFWPIFIHWWPCDYTWKSMRWLAKVLRRVGPCDPYLYAYLYGDDQGVFYDSLPDRITIFRGTCRSRVKNAICWTDDIEIARDFVLSRRSYRNPVMATAVINKNEIFMANRDMREILALPRIINVEPLVGVSAAEEADHE